MVDFLEFNKGVIEEFRENDGVVGGMFEGMPIVLVTMTGARSGKRRTIPLMYVPYREGLLLVASQGGAPKNPVWYHNLVKLVSRILIRQTRRRATMVPS